MEKFISKNLSDFFNTELPFNKPDSLGRKWGNKQYCQHQMFFVAQYLAASMVFRADLLIPYGNDHAIEELRENLRKLMLLLKYALDNDYRWKDENIDYNELCTYIDNELIKAYPDEQHTPETIPA
jgi:hypothetical protein